MGEPFLKIYPSYYQAVTGMKNSALTVLYIFMLKITETYKVQKIVEMNYNEARYLYAPKFLNPDAQRKFNVSRYSEGLKDLKARGIITPHEKAKSLYYYNDKLFSVTKNE